MPDPTAPDPSSPQASPTQAGPPGTIPPGTIPPGTVPPGARADLERWCRDTWLSIAAMTDDETGLPADNLGPDLDPESRSGYTSPTNIGGYLWSTLLAAELGLIEQADRDARLGCTVQTLAALERHPGTGMYANWYDERTGELLHAMPTGAPIDPFASSVDNGWLAAGLVVVAARVPDLADSAQQLLDSLDFGAYYDPAAGLLRGGFWFAAPDDPYERIDLRSGHGRLAYTRHCYGLLDSEPRIASYHGIVTGQLPPEHYARMGRPRLREYRGLTVLPTFGGSMFEELMPDLFVPEDVWSPDGWAVNHARAVEAQRLFGLVEADFGAWGMSPASRPRHSDDEPDYSEWGVHGIAWHETGYPCDRERTPWADGLRRGWGDGVVTPHASALAVRYAPEAVVTNLRVLEERRQAYGPGGFYDAVAVRSGLVARRYLALDQAMIMAALGNALTGDLLRRAWAGPRAEAALRPLLAADRFLDVEVAA